MGWGLVEGLIVFIDTLIHVIISSLANLPGEELLANFTKYMEKASLTGNSPGSLEFPHDQLWPLC